MRRLSLLAAASILAVAALQATAPASAQTMAPLANQITLESFTGVYHLSRDSHGLSLLTTEETILANFHDTGFTGITRELPTKFQDQSVSLKVLGVSDAAGTPIPYKTSASKDNITITTGDKDIVLAGSQTFKIRYQTSGVINLDKQANTLLLNVNGRGWDGPFNSVNATLYVPKSFDARLRGTPACYTSLAGSTANNCAVSTQQTSEATVITARARPVAARQALVMKVGFAPTTFTNHHERSLTPWLVAGGFLVIVILTIAVRRRGRSKHT